MLRGVGAGDAQDLRLVGHAVDAHVDDHGAFPDEVAGDQAGLAHRRHQDVGLAADGRQVACPGMGADHGGVAGHEQLGLGLADEQAAADDHGGFPFQLDAVGVEHGHDAGGRAGRQAGAAQHQAAQVEGVQAVHVLVRVDRLDQGVAVEPFRQRHLQQDSVYAAVRVQALQETPHIGLRSVGGQAGMAGSEPRGRAGVDLALDVDFRGGVLPDEDRGQGRNDAGPGRQAGRLFAHPVQDAFRGFRTVQYRCLHGLLLLVM